MRARIGMVAALLLWALIGCEAPDADRDGFVIVDEEARAAGVAVEVDGVTHEGALPVAVPGGGEAAVRRRDGESSLTVAPGELIEVVGAGGEVRRMAVPRDGFVVDGEPDAVRSFAEMIGAQATPTLPGRFMIRGPNAFALAALIGRAPGVRGMRPAEPTAVDVLDVGFVLERGAPESTEAVEGQTAAALPAGPTPDPTALVGLYQHGDVGLLLDAAGGYALSRGDQVLRRGRYRPRPGGVDFVPDDGGEVATMALAGEQLVDDVGIEFTP